MALAPFIRRSAYPELQIHALQNHLNNSASALIKLMGSGLLSYLQRSDSEDSYV
jgi:hypothetical protein